MSRGRAAPLPRTRAGLRRALDGLDDSSIDEWVDAAGVERVRDHLFDQLLALFVPDDTDDLLVSALLHFRGRELHWGAEVRDGVLELFADRGEAAEHSALHAELSLATLLRLISGELRPLRAVLFGQVKLDGDILVARRLRRCFPDL